MDAPAVVANKNFTALYVAWMDLRSGANDRQVYFKLEALVAMSSRGLDERALADDSKGIKGHPTLGISEGEMHAAWEDSRSGVQRIYYRTALIEKDVPLSPEKGKASFPSLACGKVVGVAFEYGTDVLFASPRP